MRTHMRIGKHDGERLIPPPHLFHSGVATSCCVRRASDCPTGLACSSVHCQRHNLTAARKVAPHAWRIRNARATLISTQKSRHWVAADCTPADCIPAAHRRAVRIGRHFHLAAIHVAWVHGILAGGKHQLPVIHRFVVERVAIAHLARFAADDTMQIMHYLLELLGALVCGPRPRDELIGDLTCHRDGFAQALAAQLLTARRLVDIVRQFLQTLHCAACLLLSQPVPVVAKPVAGVDDAPRRLVHGVGEVAHTLQSCRAGVHNPVLFACGLLLTRGQTMQLERCALEVFYRGLHRP